MYDYSYDPYYYSSQPSSVDAAAITAVLLGLGTFLWILLVVGICLLVLILVARWKMFKKANIDGWESLIPVHSEIVELQLGGVSTAVWFLNLIAICGIGPIIFAFWKNIALAKAFGKGTGFGILLTLLPVIAYPILGFGKAEYVGANQNQVTETV